MHVRFAHSRGEEQLIVHRQPEQDADQDDRQEAQDRPGAVQTDDLGAPAPLEDRDDQTVRREQREHESTRRDDRHEQRAEHDDHDEQREPDDDHEVERQHAGQRFGDVDVDRGLPGDTQRDAAVELRKGADVLHELLGRRAVGALGGEHLEREQGVVVGCRDRRHGDHIVEVGERLRDIDLRREQVVVAHRVVERRSDEQRTVRAFAELLVDDVESTVARGVRRLAAPVGQAEAHRHRGDRDDQQRDDADEHRDDRTQRRHARHGLARRVRLSDRGARSAAEQAGADESENGGGERDRDENRHGDAHRADRAHESEERHTRHVEREQSDDHRGAGEHDRGARGPGREPDGLPHGHAVEQLLAVPVHDEERVVDADREAEHDAQHRSHGCHVDHAREGEGCGHADAHTHDGRHDRERGADQRAEHDDQHDGGEGEADRLAHSEDLGHALSDVGAEVDLDAVDRRRLEVLDRAFLDLFGELEARVFERDVDDRGRPVVGHDADAVRQLEQGRAQVGLLGVGLELRAGVVDGLLLGVELGGLGVQRLDLRIQGGELRGGGAAGLGLRPSGSQLREPGVELRTSGIELGLPGIQLRAAVGDLPLAVCEFGGLVGLLLLSVEGVDDRGDTGEVFRARREFGDLLPLLLGEGRAVGRLVDDRAGAAGGVGQLLGELVGNRTGGGARDVEAVAQRAAERQERADAEPKDHDPRDDHRPCSACGE